MRGGDRCHDREVADIQPPDPVQHRDPGDLAIVGEPIGQGCRDLSRAGVAGILQHVDRPTAVVVAHLTDEDDDSTGLWHTDRRDDLIGR